MSKCGQLALEEASSTPAKGIFEWSLVACEPFDGESCQAGGRSMGRASHPSFSGKSFEETSWLGTIGSAAYGLSRMRSRCRDGGDPGADTPLMYSLLLLDSRRRSGHMGKARSQFRCPLSQSAHSEG